MQHLFHHLLIVALLVAIGHLPIVGAIVGRYLVIGVSVVASMQQKVRVAKGHNIKHLHVFGLLARTGYERKVATRARHGERFEPSTDGISHAVCIKAVVIFSVGLKACNAKYN